MPSFSDSDTLLHTDQQGDPVAIDLLLSSDVPLAPLDTADDCPELQAALEAPVEDDGSDHRDSIIYAPTACRATASAYQNSIYARLVEFGLLKKVTDIVLAEVKIPWSLRDDAAQAMHLKWCLIQAKDEYQRNQLAFYAFKSGQHAALAERRMLGAVCVLPGAIFREGKGSPFMETIGAAVNPMDVDEYKDSMELSVESPDMMHLAAVSKELMDSRFQGLGLSNKQVKVARMVLVDRLDAAEIAHRLAMRENYVERIIKQVTQKLNDRDAGIVSPKAPRSPTGAMKQAKRPEPRAEKTGGPAQPCAAEKVKSPPGATPRLRRRVVPRVEREAAL